MPKNADALAAPIHKQQGNSSDVEQIFMRYWKWEVDRVLEMVGNFFIKIQVCF